MFGTTAACLVVAVLALGSDPFQRTWTDTQGRSLEGSFVRLEGDQVTIKMDSGEVSVPLSRLSLSDRKYARDRAAADAADATEKTDSAAGDSAASEDGPAKPLATGKAIANPERVWTDRNGQKMKGKFIRIRDGNVVIQGAKTLPVPFALLSADDQQWIKDYKESRGEGDEVPDIIAMAPNGFPGHGNRI